MGASISKGYNYHAPDKIYAEQLARLTELSGRPFAETSQLNLLKAKEGSHAGRRPIYYAGDVALLRNICVCVVGARKVSRRGAARARRLSKELAQEGVVIVSGLANGVDTEALVSADSANGRIIGVVGTPLNRVYPAQNAQLQERIWRQHLLITPFVVGAKVSRRNFPQRNRVMAVLSDATVIVEASDRSGTLHQATECVRQGRWLFIMRSIVEDSACTWPERFLCRKKVKVIEKTSDVTDCLKAG